MDNNSNNNYKTPNSTHPRMTVADRAKQFAPFSPLTGFYKALAAKEKIIVDRPELSEESLAELDRRMHDIQLGQMVTIVYYHNGEYIKQTGMVAKIEPTSRILQIVNTRISFDDIVEIWFS